MFQERVIAKPSDIFTVSQRHHTSFKRDMDKKLLTTLTPQNKESVRCNALHQDCLRAVTGLRAISIIIAIRRAVVG